MAVEFLNIDCMAYMATLPDKAFDLAVVDPPYGINIAKSNNIGFGNQYDLRGGKKIKVTSLRNIWEKKEWDKNTPPPEYFSQIKRVSKNQIIWGINYFNCFLGSGRIVWDKVCNEEVNDSAEEAFCSLHNSIKIFRFLWNGIMQGKSTMAGNVPQGNKALYEKRIHPTQKPVALYKWLLHNYAKPGDRILDTHGGSMSSAIAAEHMGFDMTICELDKDYFDAGVKRFKEQTQQIQMFK